MALAPFFKTISWCAALAALGCGTPDAGHQTWDPLEETDIVERMGSPTGTIDTSVPMEAQSSMQQRLPGLFEASYYLGQVLYQIDQIANDDQTQNEAELPEVTTPENSKGDSIWSTNLYLDLACPGDSLELPFDFENGSLRIQSPEIRGLDFGPLVDEGQFLMSFRNCHMGPLVFDAEIPGKYMGTSSELIATLFDDPSRVPQRLIALDLSEVQNSDLGIVVVACGSDTTTCNEDVLLAAEIVTPSSGSYVVWFRGTRQVWSSWRTGTGSVTTVNVGIIAKNERAQCSASYDTTQGASLDCD